MCELGACRAPAKQTATNTSSVFDPESLDFEQTILQTSKELLIFLFCFLWFLQHFISLLYCKWKLILDFNPNAFIARGRELMTWFYLSLFLDGVTTL